MSSQATRPTGRVTLRYDVATVRDEWTLPEEPMPESQPHDLVLDQVKALLLFWVARTGRSAQVARNLAVRWDEARPSVGVDPDLCVISPRTPEGDELTSLCTWKQGHAPPVLALEVVSESKPREDYVSAPERYAASGTRELWMFDPKLAGPVSHGGPHRIQVWRRSADDSFDRVYAGEGPAWSVEAAAWLFAVDEGRRLRLADDIEGTSWWHTAEEAERAAKEAALARVAALEAELQRRASAGASAAEGEPRSAVRRAFEFRAGAARPNGQPR